MKSDETSTVAFRGPSPEPSTPSEAIPWFEGAIEDEDPGRAPTLPVRAPRTAPPAPPPPPAPARVPGTPRLRDEGEIARGGMGAIRRLYDTDLRRHIAMKVLEPELDNHPTAKQRFIDEARITGLLDHANIVPVHDLIVDSRGVVSYTMKLVHGQTLSELIASQTTQRDLERILEVLIKVCDALSFAHSRGVVHRDLKPDNIMVGEFGQVFVMDWGCAQVIGEDRSIVEGRVDPDGIVIGTAQYMAPEQAFGDISHIDGRTDVFAVGAILYKVLTGSPPYPGPTTQAILAAQRCEIRPPEQMSTSGVTPPPVLSQITMKALARDPAERFQSTEELAEALRSFLRGGNWFPLKKFAPGAWIVREGDRPDAAYIIVSGHCEVRKTDPSRPGHALVLRTLKAGDVFGETAIFADAPRSASVIAVDEVHAVVVDRGSVDTLIRSSWLGMFVKALADRFIELDAKVAAERR